MLKVESSNDGSTLMGGGHAFTFGCPSGRLLDERALSDTLILQVYNEPDGYGPERFYADRDTGKPFMQDGCCGISKIDKVAAETRADTDLMEFIDMHRERIAAHRSRPQRRYRLLPDLEEKLAIVEYFSHPRFGKMGEDLRRRYNDGWSPVNHTFRYLRALIETGDVPGLSTFEPMTREQRCEVLTHFEDRRFGAMSIGELSGFHESDTYRFFHELIQRGETDRPLHHDK